ncbi:winged helix-turn-helix domain-containing protein [Mycobacterium sp. 48b]|uniref:winged helix-turn-helix domain-containing protein n=1 Tax=Mycobacterium sp. 48b TaxID=3400426 RepID=UPI003AAA7A8E
MPITDEQLRKAGAQRRLAASREQRLIVLAVLAGRSQTVIAKLIGVSQPQISRTIAAVKRQNNGTLKVAPKSALDIIDERDAGEIDTPAMMQALRALNYTHGHVAKVGGVSTDAYARGSWDDIDYAFHEDKLSFAEYSELFRTYVSSR